MDAEPKGGRQVRRLPPAEITERARAIVTGTTLIARPADEGWRMALSLIAGSFVAFDNLGLILVPLGNHRGRWLNGSIPFPVMEAEALAVDDVDALAEEIAAMNAVLWPAATNEGREDG